MPARPRTCPTCATWIKTNVTRHIRRCKRSSELEPQAKRRRVEVPAVTQPVTKRLVAHKITTTRTEILQGVRYVEPGVRSKSGLKSKADNPTVARMLEVGVSRAVLEKQIARNFQELRIEPTMNEEFKALVL